MTNAREVVSYIVAHLIGFALTSLLSAFVLVPIYMSSTVARSAVNRYTIALVVFAIVQTIVFGIFITLRGRAGRPA